MCQCSHDASHSRTNGIVFSLLPFVQAYRCGPYHIFLGQQQAWKTKRAHTLIIPLSVKLNKTTPSHKMLLSRRLSCAKLRLPHAVSSSRTLLLHILVLDHIYNARTTTYVRIKTLRHILVLDHNYTAHSTYMYDKNTHAHTECRPAFANLHLPHAVSPYTERDPHLTLHWIIYDLTFL
jgi:hypothetical protein